MADSVSGLAALRDYWPRRFTLVGLCFCSTFICYIDRVNISVAILPMAQEYGWNQTTQGVVLSSFFYGYLATQIFGGWLADQMDWVLFFVLTTGLAVPGLLLLFWLMRQATLVAAGERAA